MSRLGRDIFFMYLKKLYNHNKLLCLLIALFALAQFINNIRQDIAISPLYSYGMYSERMMPETVYSVPEIFVNDTMLRTKDFSPMEWDNIMQPVIKFHAQYNWNVNLWKQDIHRLVPFADSVNFVNQLDESQFKAWYQQHLENILQKQIDTLKIVLTNYSFDERSFTRINK